MASQFNNGEGGLSIRTKLNNNAVEISTDTTNIATNTASIATNTTNIAINTTNIATNTTNIATNTTNITTNTNAITALTTTVSTGLSGKQDKNAVSTLFCNIRLKIADWTLQNTDKNVLFIATTSAPTLFNITNSLNSNFDNGGHFWIYNHSTSSDNITITPAGGVTLRGSVTITPGQTVKIDRLDTNEWSRNEALPLVLATIAALSPSNDDILQFKTGVWTNRTVAQYKTDLALNNVDNTSDTNKPVSTAQATAIALKQDANQASTLNESVTNTSASVTVGNTDNHKLWNIDTNGGNKSLVINTGLTMKIGSSFQAYNSGAAANSLTVSGTATAKYANGTTSTIADDECCCFFKIAADTYLRVY